jgi:ribonuclease D
LSTPWLLTSDDVDRAFGRWDRPALALDSESDSLHHHREKVCLIQAGDGGRGWLIDPLAGPDLAPLGRVVADPAIVKVLHGADYDVVTLKRDFGFVFSNIFDTMIAARFLGLPAVGLQAIALAELGVELSKDSQRDDWSRRPLTPRQEAYALSDVAHLLVLHERLSTRLRDKGRLYWVEEECEAVAALPPSRRRQGDDYLGVKGARKLSPRQLAALRELYAWREAIADRTDIPSFKIVGTEALLALAQKAPADLRHLEKLRAESPELRPVTSRLLREHGGTLMEALARARAVPERDLPRLPKSAPRPVVDEPTRQRGAALKAWRTTKAAALEVDVSVVLPQRLLDKVAEAAPRAVAELENIEGLRRWRIAEFGPELVSIGGAGAVQGRL